MKRFIISVCFKDSQTQDKDGRDGGKAVNWYNTSEAKYGSIHRVFTFKYL